MQASHVARNRAEPENLVTGLESKQGAVTIDWCDGHQSVFHPVWLRDNCSCDMCGDHSGGHRFFELNMLPKDLTSQIDLVDGLVRIKWVDEHVTTYDPSWLRSGAVRCIPRRGRRILES